MDFFREVVPEEKRGEIMSLADNLIEKGKLEGIQLEKKHIACNMLAKGQSVAFISEVTELSEEDIKELQKEGQLQKH